MLRPDLSGEPRFIELLSRVRREALAAYAHQDVPFEKLVESSGAGAEPSVTPLFQVMFTWQNAGLRELALPGLRLTPQQLPEDLTRFDLSLALQEAGGVIGGVLSYSTDLFDGTTIARWMGQLEAVLRACVDTVDITVTELPLLSAAERQQLVREWSGTGGDESGTICSLFAAQVERHGEAVAVVCGEERLSYRELDGLSNRLAHHLRDLGVGPEVPVGLCAERSLDLVVGLLGILKAGGAYVPLDPGYPAERLALLIEDTLMPVVAGQQHLLADLPVTPWTQLVPLDGEAFWREQESFASPEPQKVELSGESLAYVMYTSGSTGRPKGVGVVHRGVVRLMREGSFMHFGPGEVFLQLAPVSFDASTLEIWGALLTGGCLVVPPPITPSLEDLGRWIDEGGVTSLWLTAGLFHEMVERSPASLRPLRQLLAGGDVLRPQAVRRALSGSAGAGADQRLWPDGEHHLHGHSSDGGDGRSTGGWEPGADRPSDLGHRGVCGGPRRPAGGAGSRGRASGRRRGSRAGVWKPPGSDRGAMGAGRFERRSGPAAVPDGGPGALAHGRAAGVSGPGGPAGQGARVSRRAG